jgi:hypothetical protein
LDYELHLLAIPWTKVRALKGWTVEIICIFHFGQDWVLICQVDDYGLSHGLSR